MKMHPDDVKNIKCDTCTVVCGLYMYGQGWRCPECIWKEREKLLAIVNSLLGVEDYDPAIPTAFVMVPRHIVDNLATTVERMEALDSKRS